MLWLLQLYLYLLLCIPLLQVYHLMFNKNKIRIKKTAPIHQIFTLVSFASFVFSSLLSWTHTQRGRGRKTNQTSHGNKSFDTTRRKTHNRCSLLTFSEFSESKQFQSSDHLMSLYYTFKSSELKSNRQTLNMKIYIFVEEKYQPLPLNHC